MRARLALAQALLPNPELLILDEPGDGLDPEGIHELRLTILRLRRELNLTILLSSHLLNEVQQLCTRIAVVRQGRKVFDGTLDAIAPAGNVYRLGTDKPNEAVAWLRKRGLLADPRKDDLIAFTGEAVPAQALRGLVEAGFEVHEFARVQPTLEDFYLRLMHPDAKMDKDAKPSAG